MKSKKLILLLIIASFLILQPIAQAKTSQSVVQVKKSTTGICHKIGSTYYNRTKIFKAYKSISDCLKSGGRLPK